MLRFLVVLALCLPVAAAAEDVYRARFSPAIDSVSVAACFHGPPPHILYRDGSIADFAGAVRYQGRDLASPTGGSRVRLPPLVPGSCLEWSVDLGRAAEALSRRSIYRAHDTLLADLDLWFWRDGEKRPLRVEVELPAGIDLSTPWQEAGWEGSARVFRPDPTPASWSARFAIGPLAIQRISVGGTDLRLAVIGSLSEAQQQALAQWIQQAAASVADVTGRFPRAHPQVLVVATGPQSRVVPWAHVLRGGGAGIEFFVDETRSLAELEADWTAPHEFSHLLLPYVSRRDRWLSEGLASYYQNVLRARAGRLGEGEAWNLLHRGFERGRANTTSGTLAEATRSGHGATMRVYWSGAALLLMADARLRALTSGSQSLDTVLAGLQSCCTDVGRSWRAADLFREMDRLSGFTVFTDLYRAHVYAAGFPDLAPIYRELGLVAGPGGLTLDRAAPWSRIRHFIMNPPSGAGAVAGGCCSHLAGPKE